MTAISYTMMTNLWVTAAAVVAATSPAAAFAPETATVTTLRIDLRSKPEQQSLTKFWQASVGSGHAALGLRKDWQEQLKAVHDDLGIDGVRFHGSFDDDMGPVVTLDTDGLLMVSSLFAVLGGGSRSLG
jgi:hypothetical protein